MPDWEKARDLTTWGLHAVAACASLRTGQIACSARGHSWAIGLVASALSEASLCRIRTSSFAREPARLRTCGATGATDQINRFSEVAPRASQGILGQVTVASL